VGAEGFEPPTLSL